LYKAGMHLAMKVKRCAIYILSCVVFRMQLIGWNIWRWDESRNIR